MFDLRGKSILITGGSRGIGRATALLAANLGANVAITYQSNHSAASKLKAQVESRGVQFKSLKAETVDEAPLERFVGEICQAWGSLDVAVANAGIWNEGKIDLMSVEEFRHMMDVNMTGSFVLAKVAAKKMIVQKRGSIVLISSTAGQRGESEHSHYAASKGAQISFVKSLAPELASHNIRVNCVAPGWVETDMTTESLATIGDKIRAQIPLGRAAKPEEIANAILFLAGDAASFITGEVLNVNGGAVLCG